MQNTTPMQQALNNSEALVRTLFEQDAIGVAQIETATGRFARINQRYCDILGYTRQEMEGIDWQSITHPDDLPENLNNLQRFIEGQIRTFATEKRYHRKDKTVVWVELIALPMWPPGEPPDFHIVLAEDITERKKSELALRESEALISSIGNNLPNGMLYQIVRDKEGGRKFAYVSDAVRRFYGFSPEEAMANANHIYGRVLEEDLRRVHVQEENANKSFSTFSTECRIKNPDGSIRWSYFASSPRKLENGATCWDGIEIDITERKQAEESLQMRKRHLKAILDTTQEGFGLFTEDGRITEVNNAICHMLGYNKTELLTKRISEIVADEDPGITIARLQRIKAGQAEAFESIHRRKDGSFFHVEISLNYTKDFGGQFFCFCRDITERKRMEENLQKEKLFSEHIINSLPGVFYLFDENGKYLRWNKNIEVVTGYTAEDMERISPEDLVPDEEKSLVAQGIQETFAKGSAHLEAHLVSREGTRTPYFFTGQRVLVENRPCVIGLGIDITERKILEEQLLQARKMESLGRLAGGVAHDFNNMLQAMLGYTELALAKTEPDIPLHENLVFIQKATERSAALTGQLLAFARKQTANPKVLDLNDAVTGILKILRRLIGENIELIWKPGANLWPVKVDSVQIDQVLTNLAVNARDAISGVGRLIIETDNVFLDQACCQNRPDFTPGEYVLLTISDNGCGMNREALEHIFEPFFTTKEMGRGTGLGLATVYGIIRQNNGMIDVASAPGEGTIIRIYLPRSSEAAVTVAATRKHPARGSGAILLVEDDETVLKLAETILEMHGYTVLAATTPGAALSRAQTHEGPIHLLITDVVMPEMNGKVLKERIASLRPGIKTLFISGYTADVIAHHGVLESGINFLQKPFSLNVLAAKVREVLDAD